MASCGKNCPRPDRTSSITFLTACFATIPRALGNSRRSFTEQSESLITWTKFQRWIQYVLGIFILVERKNSNDWAIVQRSRDTVVYFGIFFRFFWEAYRCVTAWYLWIFHWRFVDVVSGLGETCVKDEEWENLYNKKVWNGAEWLIHSRI